MRSSRPLLLALLLVLTLLAPALAEQTPTQFYQRFLKAQAKSQDLKSLSPFFTRAKVKKLNTYSDAELVKFHQIIKMMNIHAIRIEEEKLRGDQATLTATAKMNSFSGKVIPAWGTVELVKESGSWKISEETWSDQKR